MTQQPGYVVLDGWTTEVNKPCQEGLRSAGEIERGRGYSAKKNPDEWSFLWRDEYQAPRPPVCSHEDHIMCVLIECLTTDRVCSN